jgi:hypothetical protein
LEPKAGHASEIVLFDPDPLRSHKRQQDLPGDRIQDSLEGAELVDRK